jgi:hypothetical protein
MDLISDVLHKIARVSVDLSAKRGLATVRVTLLGDESLTSIHSALPPLGPWGTDNVGTAAAPKAAK